MGSNDWSSLIGFEIAATRYYSTAVMTLFFYDYLITLQDEVQYVWREKKSWIFFLFLLNRYTPILYEIWTLVAFHDPVYAEKVCIKSIIVEIVYFVFTTLLAQAFLVARLYALTKRKLRILVAFSFLTVVHVAVGVFSIVSARNAPSILVPFGTLDICIMDSPLTFIIRAIYTFFSLAYDTLLLLTLIWVSYSTCGPRSTWPTILKTIMEDSALYFLAVLASHFPVALFMILDPSDMRYFSSVGINTFTPAMISRLVLSLRKAADRTTNVSEWISENIAFGPNPEPAVRTQPHVELFGFPSRGTSLSSDARDLTPSPLLSNMHQVPTDK